ncbi:hypothetical protein Sste5346_004804 [Sporothrix stenoceras]|uniref:C6 zinc finger domain containing protein n=1 Tax=Sporothrix stenoceras TaxID=5173 RepID=A0ABR3Z622_9PEZI
MEIVMDGVAQQRAPRPKVKTGCATCRESRKGMGKAAPSKTVTPAMPLLLDETSLESTSITDTDIADLQRCFSTKTLFPTVTLACADEARQVLQASQTDPAVRHAVFSLRALRADLEATAKYGGGGQSNQPTHLSYAASSYAAATGTTPNRDYGLQQYCMALGGLASHLSTSPSTTNTAPAPSVRTALLCCQVFISIEQVRGHFAAMAQHIVQGLRILYEHRGRDQDLPAIDVFIIKLFAAPCKFADVTRGVPSSAGSTPASTTGSEGGTSCRFRPLAPDLRSELTRHAMSTVSFLASVKAGPPTQSLQSTKELLLQSLTTWYTSLEREKQTTERPQPELLSILFLRFFHQILRVVLLSALDSDGQEDKDRQSEIMDTEYKQLQRIASFVGEQVHADGLKSGEW